MNSGKTRPWSRRGADAHPFRLPASSSKNKTRHNLCTEATGARFPPKQRSGNPPKSHRYHDSLRDSPGSQATKVIPGAPFVEKPNAEMREGGGGGRFRLSEREKECDLRITLREGLRVDSRKIEGGGPLGREDRKQEADKRHRGAYPTAHGEQIICAREEQCSAQGDGIGFWTYTVFLTPPIEYNHRKA